MATKMLFVGGPAHGTIREVSEEDGVVRVTGPPATLVEVMDDPVGTLATPVTAYYRQRIHKGFGRQDEAFIADDLLRESWTTVTGEYVFALIRALVGDVRMPS